MENKKLRNQLLIYIFGIFIATLGINMLLRSQLGAGPWDAVTYNLSVLTGLTLGTTSAVINLTLIAIVLGFNRNKKYLIIVLPTLVMAVFIDFWDLIVLRNYYPSHVGLQVIFLVVGLYIISIGIALMIRTNLITMALEELTKLVMRILKTKQFLVGRFTIEMIALSLATLFGLMANIGLGAIGYTTLFIAVVIGPLISFNMKMFKKIDFK